MRLRFSKQNFLLLALVAFFLIPQVSDAATIGRPANNLGLVGYWNFDVGSGSSTAYDASGSGNEGVMTNMDASSDWVSGKIGGALDFDGSNDNLVIADDAALDITGDLTIAAWINSDTVSGYDEIVIKGTDGNTYNYYLSRNGNEILFGFSNPSGTWHEVDTDSVNIDANVWYHIAAVYSDGGNFVRMYLDGEEVGASVNAGSPLSTSLATNNQDLLVGGDTQVYPGQVDEVRIYDRVLSPGEIRRLHKLGESGGQKRGTTLSLPTDDGLLAHWTFDGPDRLRDVTGNGYHGSWEHSGGGNTTTSTAPGVIGQAVDLDGDAGSRHRVFVSGLMGEQTDLTVCAWFNLQGVDVSAGQSQLWGIGDFVGLIAETSGSSQFRIYWREATGWFDSGDVSGSLLNTGWHHGCGTFDDTADAQVAYLDGKAFSSNTRTASIDYSNASYGTDTRIGRNGDYNDRHWDGLVDDVRMYSRALSAAEIADLYNATKGNKLHKTSSAGSLSTGLVGHWTFDGNVTDTSTSTDVSGSGFDGTLSGGPVPTMGRVGQAFSFDGVDDIVDINTPISSLISASEGSLAVWVRPETEPSNSTRIYTGRAIVNDVGGYIGIFQAKPDDFSNLDRLWLYNYVTTSHGVGIPYTLNEWIHVVWVHSGGVLYGYKNGELWGSTASGDTDSLAGDFVINRGHAGALYFPGDIDDVRVYSRALTADEIRRLYNLGK